MLEEQTGLNVQSGTELVLEALRAIGYEELCLLLAMHDTGQGREPGPFWLLMNLMDDRETPFEFERYRRLVPDEVIRRAYNIRRNFAYPKEISARIRNLAGLTDDAGNLMPGYKLLDNGCIADVPATTKEETKK